MGAAENERAIMASNTPDIKVGSMTIKAEQVGSGAKVFGIEKNTYYNVQGSSNPAVLLSRLQETEAILKTLCPQTYVETAAFMSVLEQINKRGRCLVRGRPGEGKTELGRQMLKRVHQTQAIKTLELKKPSDWDCIPCPKDRNNISQEEKYIVFADNVFGPTHLDEKKKNEWLSELSVSDKVTSGQVKLLIASRTNIAVGSEASLREHSFFGTIPVVEFDPDTDEKEKILRVFLTHANLEDKLSEENIKLAARLSPDLGFPQCCKYFVENKDCWEAGLEFFRRPFDFLSQQLDTLRETSRSAYCVLVLTMMNGGSLCPRDYDPFTMTVERKEKLGHVSELCGEKGTIPAGEIMEQVRCLSGTYFVEEFVDSIDEWSDSDEHDENSSEDDDSVGSCSSDDDSNDRDRNNEKTASIEAASPQIMSQKGSIPIPRHVGSGSSTGTPAALDTAVLTELATDVISSVPADVVASICVLISNTPPATRTALLSLLPADARSAVLAAFPASFQNALSTGIPGDVLTGFLPPSGASDATASTADARAALSAAFLGDQRASLASAISAGTSRAGDAASSVNIISTFISALPSDVIDAFDATIPEDTKDAVVDVAKEVFAAFAAKNYASVPASALADATAINVAEFPASLLQASNNDSQHDGRNTKSGKKKVSFSHQSMYETVFVHFCTKCSEQAISICPIELIAQYVKTNKLARSAVSVYCSDRKLLADRLVQELKGGDVATALSFPALKDKKFGKFVVDSCFDDIADDPQFLNCRIQSQAFIICCHLITSKTEVLNGPTRVDHESLPACLQFERHCLLESTSCLCHMLSQGLCAFVTNVLQRLQNSESPWLSTENWTQQYDQVLAFACLYGDSDLCSLLLEMAAKPSVDCLTALCSAEAEKPKIFQQIMQHSALRSDLEKELFQNDLLWTLAIQNCNSETFKLLLDQIQDADQRRAISQQAYKLLLALGHGLSCYSVPSWGTKKSSQVKEIFKILLKSGAECDLSRDLLVAAGHKSPGLMRLILEKGASVNSKDLFSGCTALHFAARFGGKETVKFLLQKGADPSEKSNCGLTPLHVIFMGHVPSLLSNGDKILLPHVFIPRIGHLEDKLRQLLDAGSDINAKDAVGRTPLHFFFSTANDVYDCYTLPDLWRYSWVFFDMYHKAYKLDQSMWKPLDCKSGQMYCPASLIGVFQMLIQKNVDLQAIDASGKSLLQSLFDHALWRGYMLDFLIKNGMGPQSCDKDGKTQLHLYLSREVCHTDVVRHLCNVGIDPNAKDRYGRTALHLYCQKKVANPRTVRCLVEKGANPGILDSDNRSPLHEYCRHSNVPVYDTVVFLVERGADLHVQDKNGRTVLHEYCHRSFVPTFQIIKYLVENGADPSVQDSCGKTPLHEYCYHSLAHALEAIQCLVEHGADLHAKDEDQRTPLLEYCYHSHLPTFETVKYLVDQGSDPSVQDKKDQTVLHLYSTKPFMEIQAVKYLIEKGADPTVRNITGQTALDIYCSRTFRIPEIIDCLSCSNKKAAKNAVDIDLD